MTTRIFGSNSWRVFAVLIVLGLTSCQRPEAAASTTPIGSVAIDSTALEAELSEFNTRLTQAYEAEDIAALETMLAPEHIHNNVFGMRLDKDTFLADIRSGVLVFERYETPSIQWFIYQDVAIATGIIEAVAYRSGKQVPSTSFTFTRVFARKDGAWQVLLFQNTIVRPPPK